jgi:hypothetical protein
MDFEMQQCRSVMAGASKRLPDLALYHLIVMRLHSNKVSFQAKIAWLFTQQIDLAS